MKKNISLVFVILFATMFMLGCTNNSNTVDNTDSTEGDTETITIPSENSEIPFFSTEEELFEIETPYCNLYYPLMWKDQIMIEFEEDNVYTVKFSAKTDSESIPLFDLKFGGEDGDKIGELTNEEETIELNMISYGFDLDGYSEDMSNDICGMNEDINVIVSKLIELYDFKLVNEEQ